MNYKEIQELIRLVKRNNITELEIEKKDFKISIRSQQDKVVSEPQQIIQQPMVAQPVAVAAPTQPQVETVATALAPPPASSEPQAANLVEIKSPMIGTFYRAPGPDKDPYVSIGDQIQPGQVIYMIEAMKLFNEIESDYSGKIVKILVEDATPVEFDQPLFLIDPTA